MGIVSFPSTIYHKPLVQSTSFPPVISHAKHSFQKNHQYLKASYPKTNQKFKACVANNNFHSKLSSYQPIQTSFSSSKHRGSSRVPVLNAKTSLGSSGDGEDSRALETVLKLYSAIKNQNVGELSNIIADECRCVFNFGSFVQAFQGKQQVLEFFKHLISNMGPHFEFVLEPTLHEGTSVGVRWKIVRKNIYVPFGKGFGCYICHDYRGDMFIRNIEMFMEPLVLIEPLRLFPQKIMVIAMALADKLTADSSLMIKIKMALSILLPLLLVAALLVFKH